MNNQDGFSTSGTILFYLDGMKEAGGVGFNYTNKLIGPEEIELSVTRKSMTLLIDLDSQNLIHHFAEIDYLDEERPLIIVQASKSLEHNRRYALAVLDAADMNGDKLPTSEHLKRLLGDHDTSLPETEQRRGDYYQTTVLPTLYKAAPWLDENTTLCLLFDFHTASIESQLGDTRKIVKGSLDVVADAEWSGWGDHNVRVVKMIDNEMCIEENNNIGRVIHVEMVLPSFLLYSNKRAKQLDREAINRGDTTSTANFKVLVVVPCSISRGTIPLKALVDYGHGFLYSRQELLDAGFLHRVANEEGYILFASNWRGMSYLDLTLIIRAFVAEPNLLDSVQANIMQGYGNKAAIQHFVRNSLLDMSFMKFDGKPIRLNEERDTRYLFYGISQGGILGSAYTSLMSQTGLLDGSIITSAGSPLSLIMSRSAIFVGYQTLLLMSLHFNRHVRIFVSLLQVYFDGIDGPSVGLVGDSYGSNKEFKTLIQTGLVSLKKRF